MLKVDRHSTTMEFAPFLACVKAEDMERLRRRAVEDKYGEAGFAAMTVGELTTVLGGDPRPLYQSGGRTVFDWCRVEAFQSWVDEFSATLKRMTLPSTPDSVRLSAGVMPSEFVESVYIFCRGYFNLKSYEEADRLKVSEYLLARKDDYNRQVVDRNVAASMKGGKR